MAIDDLYTDILVRAVDVIRTETILPALVNHATLGDRSVGASRGGITEVIVPPEFSTRNVVPAPTPPASSGAPNPSTVQVPLNYWKETDMQLTTAHAAQMENAGADVPMFIANMASPIVEDITNSLMAQYPGIYAAAGVAGTTPFASDPSVAQTAKKLLSKNKCPKMMRKLVLNTDAYSNATALDQFRSADRSGSNMTLLEGEIGRGIGFDWHEDVGIDDTSHVNANGDPSGWLVNQADHAAGDTTVAIDTGSNEPVAGDLFSVAGDDRTYYRVVSYAAGTLTYAPAADEAWADNAAITFVAEHTLAGLAFNPFAFAFDSRPEAELQISGVKQNFLTWVDEMTGVVLRLEIREGYHCMLVYLSCLWGSVLVDPRLACRILG